MTESEVFTAVNIFQPMPALSAEQYAALRDSIAAEGVTIPVVVDQHGRTLDGHNRRAIAAELGIDCPTIVRQVADDDEAWRVAVELNCARRHLSQEQVRHLVREELMRHWGDSDRAISRRVGCSPSTVGSIRAIMRSDAEQSVAKAKDAILNAEASTWASAYLLHQEYGVTWQRAGDHIEAKLLANDPPQFDDEILDAMEQVFGWRFDALRAATLLCACEPCTAARDDDSIVIFRHRDDDPTYDEQVLTVVDTILDEFGIAHSSSVQIGQSVVIS